MFLKLLLAGLFILPVSCFSTSNSGSSTSTRADSLVLLAMNPIQPAVTKVSSRFLLKNHYDPRPLDDTLSLMIYNNFIESLDYSRVYFLQSDIRDFEPWKLKMDNMVLDGDLEPVYFIFNRFLERFRERLNFALKIADSPFDFEKEEYLEIDRENAPWFKTREELDEHWRKQVKYEILRQQTAGKEDLAVSNVKKRYQNLLNQSAKYKSEEVFQLFMNSYTEAYDPHSNYFSPRSSEDFRINMSLSLEGIGAQLVQDNEYVQIKDLITGGPAEQSKVILPNDRILGVAQGDDGEMVDVVGWRVDDVVQLIRGAKGTVVRLQLLHDGDDITGGGYIVRLVRDKIKLEAQAAKGHINKQTMNGKEQSVGIIRIPTFYTDFQGRSANLPDYKSTTRDVAKLISQLKDSGMTSLVIDLRRNGGGSLAEAIELTGLFIDEGPVVQVKNARGDVNVENDIDEGITWDGPLVIMIDRFAASASEIFAAAIQDYGRGVIIGEQSFGKGTVQQLIDVGRFIPGQNRDAGQLKYTMAKFYRVNGGSTQLKGVSPDLELPVSSFSVEIGERNEKTALAWDGIPPVKYRPVRELRPAIDKLREKSAARQKQNPEFAWILGDKMENQAEEKKKQISLRLSDLKAEREKQEAKKKMRAEERKKRGVSEKEDPILNEAAIIAIELRDALSGR